MRRPELRWPRLSDGEQRLAVALGALTLALIPHLLHLPPWIPLLFAGIAAWRLTLEHRGKSLPWRWLRSLIAVLGLLSVAVSYRTLNGIEAGTALLALMAGIKLLETRSLRDLTILLFIAYFLLFAALLYNLSVRFTGGLLVGFQNS